jgi:restriction system protein
MARRKTSIGEDIFVGLTQLPWWGGIICAGLFWFLGQVFMARMGNQPSHAIMRQLIPFMFNGMAILSLVAAAVSAIKAQSRRKLFDRQSSIDSVRNISWREFEQLVGEAYRRQGYAVEETGGGGADGGIDLVLRGNGETVLVQCKQWKARQVGVDKVRELFGVVTAERADRGILVTSGNFTKDALAFQAGKPLSLVDGSELVRLIQGVQPAGRPAAAAPAPAVASTDPGCPKCGSPMVLRTARRGANAGSQFYGCTRYPGCKGILPAG